MKGIGHFWFVIRIKDQSAQNNTFSYLNEQNLDYFSLVTFLSCYTSLNLRRPSPNDGDDSNFTFEKLNRRILFPPRYTVVAH